jgi:hypothetical protein
LKSILINLLASLGVGQSPTSTAIEMHERFHPARAFSIMIPADWRDVSTNDRFGYSAPNDGPSLGGSATRIDRRPDLREYADARFEGVKPMSFYKQVGGEKPLGDTGGVYREYSGTWPGDKEPTHYVVACLSKDDIYVSVALTVSERDFSRMREFYLKMLSTLTVHP